MCLEDWDSMTWHPSTATVQSSGHKMSMVMRRCRNDSVKVLSNIVYHDQHVHGTCHFVTPERFPGILANSSKICPKDARHFILVAYGLGMQG